MRAHRGRRSALSAIALMLALSMGGMALAGCETSTADDDPTPVTTWKITPADPSFLATRTAEAGGGGETPSAETPVAGTPAAETPAATSIAGSPTPDGGSGTTLTIVGVASTFEEDEYEAPAGPITIIFDNQDAGIVHNVRFFEGDDDEGEVVGETELEIGRIEQTLEMNLEAGEYFFQCDAHPATMTGTLTVE